MSWLRSNGVLALTLAGVLVLAASSGFLASQALGLGAQAPTKTVTIDVGTGQPGPLGQPGPPGPKGDPGAPGAESCPAGSTFTAVVINAPSGHLTVWACVANQ